MKKITILFLAALGLATVFSSCNKTGDGEEQAVINVDEPAVKDITSKKQQFTIDVKTNSDLDAEIDFGGVSTWLTRITETKAVSTKALTFEATAHVGSEPRSAIITITSKKDKAMQQKVKVVQAIPDQTFQVEFEDNPDVSDLSQDGNTYRLTVSEFGTVFYCGIIGEATVKGVVDDSSPWVKVESEEGVRRVMIRIDPARTGDLFDYSRQRNGVVRLQTSDSDVEVMLIIHQQPRTAGIYNVYGNIGDSETPKTLTSEIESEHSAMIASVKEVAITGPIEQEEFALLSAMPSLEVLDLRNADFTGIPVEAFSSNTVIKKLILPNYPAGERRYTGNPDVQGEEKYLFERIGEKAFYSCSALAELLIPSSGDGSLIPGISQTVKYLDNSCFYASPLTEIVIPRTVSLIGPSAFRSHKATRIEFLEPDQETIVYPIQDEDGNPVNTLEIGDNAFYGSSTAASLESDLVIPDYVSRIGDYAFRYATNVVPETDPTYIGIVIGKNVTYVGRGAFSNNNRVNKLTFKPGTKALTLFPASATASSGAGNGSFGGISPILEEITVPARVGTVPNQTFGSMIGLKKIVIEEGITEIGVKAFAGSAATAGYAVAALEELVIPSTVTAIQEGAFKWIYGLKDVTIPAACKTIGKEAFAGCKDLKNLVIPEGVESIGEGAFGGTFTNPTASANFTNDNPMLALKSITLPASLKTLGVRAFYNNAVIETITIPGDNLTAVGEEAFALCPALKSVIVNEGVTTISKSAFSGRVTRSGGSGTSAWSKNLDKPLNVLTTVTLPTSLTTIGAKAFSYAPGLNGKTITAHGATVAPDAFEGSGTVTVN